jgi:hypothetical protein
VTLVEHITAILASGGYKILSRPFAIGGLPFDFDVALIAGEKALDLIVVADLTQEGDERRLVQKIQALARALDLAKSRRPLTAVLAGATAKASTVDALGQVCRVLPVGAPDGEGVDQTLRDWLAVLLPLPHLEELSGIANWESELATQIADASGETFVAEFKVAANKNAEEVEALLGRLIISEVAVELQEKLP